MPLDYTLTGFYGERLIGQQFLECGEGSVMAAMTNVDLRVDMRAGVTSMCPLGVRPRVRAQGARPPRAGQPPRRAMK